MPCETTGILSRHPPQSSITSKCKNRLVEDKTRLTLSSSKFQGRIPRIPLMKIHGPLEVLHVYPWRIGLRIRCLSPELPRTPALRSCTDRFCRATRPDSSHRLNYKSLISLGPHRSKARAGGVVS